MAYNLSALGFAILISAFIAKKISAYISAVNFKKEHGCKPVHKLPQSERIVGFGLYRAQVKASRERKLLEVVYKRCMDNGLTWSASMMGKTFFNTIDPENIKAVLATNFDAFGIGERHAAFGALLGRGIFTSDGKQWEHSRVSRISDLVTITCGRNRTQYLRSCSGSSPTKFHPISSSRSRDLRIPHPATHRQDPSRRIYY